MDQATKDRFASGFRGKTTEKKPDAPEVAIVIAPEGDAGSINGEGATDAGTQGAGSGETGPGTGTVENTSPTGETGTDDEAMPEMTHSEKTWQGRLAKREAELKAKEAALMAANNPLHDGSHAVTAEPEETAMDPNEANEPAAEEMGETAGEEMAEAQTEPDGEALPGSTPDVVANAPEKIKAIAQRWSSDFGPDFMDDLAKFVGYIAEASAGKVASEAIGPLKAQNDDLASTLDAVIAGFQGMHQGDIEDQEPDFEQVVNSPEFEQWVTAQEPDAQQKIVRVLEGGSAGRIVRVLKDFKDFVAANAEPAPGSIDTSALDAATSVRSSGTPVPSLAGKAGGSAEDAFKRGFYRSKA